MTREEVDAAEARAKASTEGPWENWHDLRVDILPESAAHPRGRGTANVARFLPPPRPGHPEDQQRGKDAEFCAHARTDVPRLITHVRAQAAEVERLRDRLRRALVAHERLDANDIGQEEAAMQMAELDAALKGTP